MTTALQRFLINCLSPVRQSTSQVRQNRLITLREIARAEQKTRVLSCPVLQDSGKPPRLGRVRSACALHCTATESPCKHSAWVCLPQHLTEHAGLDLCRVPCPREKRGTARCVPDVPSGHHTSVYFSLRNSSKRERTGSAMSLAGPVHMLGYNHKWLRQRYPLIFLRHISTKW